MASNADCWREQTPLGHNRVAQFRVEQELSFSWWVPCYEEHLERHMLDEMLLI